MASEEEEVVGRRDLTDQVGVERTVAGSVGGGVSEEDECRVVGFRRTGRRDLKRLRLGRRITVVMVKRALKETSVL
jgi:hypothetical protein